MTDTHSTLSDKQLADNAQAADHREILMVIGSPVFSISTYDSDEGFTEVGRLEAFGDGLAATLRISGRVEIDPSDPFRAAARRALAAMRGRTADRWMGA